MKKLTHGLWLAAAAALALTVGCGEPSGSDGGTGSCSSDSSCTAGDMCHPVLKKCVPTCTGSGDCPSSAKTCATIAGAAFDADAGVKAFCQCSTDALCNGGSTGSLVCMTATKTCETKCTSSSGCPSGYTCETATGQCNKGGGTDAGTDAGVPTSCAGADWDVCQTSSEFCDLTNNVCVAPPACNPASAQPDSCGFAGYCTSASTCYQVAKPTCANFTPPGGKQPVFDPRTNAVPAPIIYYYDEVAADDTAWCNTSGLNAFTVTLYAYRDDADWPTTLAQVPGFFYVKTDGSEVSATTLIRPSSGYSPSGRTASFKVNLCSSTISSNLMLGFYFTNGNEFCATATAGTVVP